MLTRIDIENYKSIDKLSVELGRFNVIIGENGAGKSNILEAIGLAAARMANKLDNEFLASRGIRVTRPELMRANFKKGNKEKDLLLRLHFGNEFYNLLLSNDNQSYSKWYEKGSENVQFAKDSHPLNIMLSNILEIHQIEVFKAFNDPQNAKVSHRDLVEEVKKTIIKLAFTSKNISDFLLYSPNEKEIRTCEDDTQFEPLVIHFEGLFKLLRVMSQNEKAEFKTLKEHLKLLGWFSDFNIEPSEFSEERKLAIKDKFLKGDLKYFDQKSSNEGFLFLLFYLALFLSKETPKFFAVENIETSLNPKLCTKLIKLLNDISKEKEKQVILTTHNPAILDGLDLNDDEQRLFVVHRNTKGHTKITRIERKEGAAAKVKLSEAFMNGYLGGLPENF
ncbi:hypothetical protein BH09BAC1_BH09BAC1_09140 [soil metagenome]